MSAGRADVQSTLGASQPRQPGSPCPWDGPGTPNPAKFRISRNGQEPSIDVDQVEAMEPALRSSKPGRYHVDEVSADPLPSGHPSRRWGAGSSGLMGPL